MIQQSKVSYQIALRDFEYARQQAVMQQLLARLRGEDAGLLSYEEIKQQFLPTGETIDHGIEEIPLEKIVGSVARYRDFTRSFLPKRDADQERWAGIRSAVQDMVGIPPIEVYQLGDAYFVQDGNHRVSIARRLNSGTITAHVIEVKTRVPLSADDDPNEIICKTYYADFLERTNLDKLRPEADLTMTICNKYKVLLDQIAARLDGPAKEDDLPVEADRWDRAAVDWYDNVYLPVIRIIRELGVLHYFPERTETDMYLLLSERRDELERDLGWNVDLESGVSELIAAPEEPRGLLERISHWLTPKQASLPKPGLWRKQQLARKRYHHLFKHILVALDGTEGNWRTFEHFLKFNRDKDHYIGLHVVPDKAALDSDSVREMRARFITMIEKAGMEGDFAVEVGSKPIQVISRQAAWVDLVLVYANRRPGRRPQMVISSELKALVQSCPRPVQVTPIGSRSDYSRAILAYDGRPMADEALFIATYLTSRWRKSLTVVTVETAHTNVSALRRAEKYLTEHGLTEVNYVLRKGPIAEMILDTAEANDCNLLFMGGFSFRSLRRLVLGSEAERVLREFAHPMWICR